MHFENLNLIKNIFPIISKIFNKSVKLLLKKSKHIKKYKILINKLKGMCYIIT